jgi:hypothetical protein
MQTTRVMQIFMVTSMDILMTMMRLLLLHLLEVVAMAVMAMETEVLLYLMAMVLLISVHVVILIILRSSKRMGWENQNFIFPSLRALLMLKSTLYGS